jgi:hypothetical protein
MIAFGGRMKQIIWSDLSPSKAVLHPGALAILPILFFKAEL